MTEVHFHATEVVDTVPKLLDLLQVLQEGDNDRIYLNLEGDDLESEDGTLKLLTLYSSKARKTFIVDVHVLGREAFTAHTNNSETSLQSILEDPQVTKVIYDIRHGVRALLKQFGVQLDGVQDLQVMATKTCLSYETKDYDSGKLEHCIGRDSRVSSAERSHFNRNQRAKDDMLRAAQYMKGKEIRDDRPLRDTLQRCCVQDVEFLVHLHQVYLERCKQNAQTNEGVQAEIALRLRNARRPFALSSCNCDTTRCPVHRRRGEA